jgi:hypothetical protein
MRKLNLNPKKSSLKFAKETMDMAKTKKPVPSKLTKGPKQKLDTKKPTLTPAQMKKAKEQLKGVESSYAIEAKAFQPKKK